VLDPITNSKMIMDWIGFGRKNDLIQLLRFCYLFIQLVWF